MSYDDFEAADINGEDFSAKILMILRCIGSIDHEIKLQVGTFFMSCISRPNREAFFRGLLEFVLCRECSTCMYFSHTDASLDDAQLVTEQARQWRSAFPAKKLRVHSLDWLPKDLGLDFIRAFLRVIDDVEAIGLFTAGDRIDAQDVKRMLQFPSLRSLYLELVHIPTMDIFDVSSTGSTESKPALESLELSGLLLDDRSSLARFIARLNPRSSTPSPLSRTLRILGVSEASPRYPRDLGNHPRTLQLLGQMFGLAPLVIAHPADYGDQNFVRRAVDDPTAVSTLEEVLTVNEMLQHVSFLGSFASLDPVHLEWSSPANPPVKSRIPATAESRRSAIVKAQSAAFLSAIRDGDSTALRLLDSNLAKLIFAFSAPHAFREILI